MASPTINYTDPTQGLVRMAPLTLEIPQRFIKISPVWISVHHWNITPYGLAGRLVYAPTSTTVPRMKTIICKVPKPPVGKMLINTFPPIYKERVNIIGLPDCPRVYPPIIFRKSV